MRAVDQPAGVGLGKYMPNMALSLMSSGLVAIIFGLTRQSPGDTTGALA